MGNFVDVAAAVLSTAGWRLELTAQNIANAATPGYRRAVSFQALVPNEGAPVSAYAIDFAQGRQVQTDNPLDLALSSNGFFAVRAPQGLLYTRAGQFQRDDQGRLVTPQGYVLQAAGGGDLTLRGSSFQVVSDGTVIEDGQPTSAIGVVDVPANAARPYGGGSYFAAPAAQTSDVQSPIVRQGAFETSNVQSATEMVRLLETLRFAESGQRLVGIYDDLMGRAINAFGGSA